MTNKEKKYSEQLKSHKGEYVAVKNMTVVASGSTALEAKKKAEQKHVKNPIIFGVPDVGKGHFFF